MTVDNVGILLLHRLTDGTHTVGHACRRTLSQPVCQQVDVSADERFGFWIDKQDFHECADDKLCGDEYGGGGASYEVLPQDSQTDAEEIPTRDFLLEKF